MKQVLLLMTMIFLTLSASHAQWNNSDSVRPGASWFGRHMAKAINYPKSAIPKSRKMNLEERTAYKVVMCIDKFLRKDFSPVNITKGQDLLSEIIANKYIRTSNNVYLNKVLGECKRYAKNVTRRKSLMNFEDKMELVKRVASESTEAESASKNVLISLGLSEPLFCEADAFEVSGGLGVVGLGAGLKVIRCFYPNGKVRKFVGPLLEGNMNTVGARVSLKRVEGHREKRSQKKDPNALRVSKGRVINFFSRGTGGNYNPAPGDITATVIFGSAREITQTDIVSMGLSVHLYSAATGFGIRTFNGKSRGYLLVDQLK